MQTYVQITNRVLRRLREDEVSNYDDTEYSTLVGDLINETIADMQDAIEWRALRDEHTVTLDGSTRVYTLSSATSENSRDTNDQTIIRRVWDDTNDWELRKRAYDSISLAKLDAPDPDSTSWWREKGADNDGNLKVEFYPDVAATVKVLTYNPHAEIAASATVVRLPPRIVFLGAYARAVNERGEDGGTQATAAWQLYQDALGAAVARELERMTEDENTWRVE